MQKTAEDSIAQEIERIIALPIIRPPTEEEIIALSLYYAPGGGLRLYPEQVAAMIQYHEYGGLVAPIAVGGGKTLVTVLVASDAFRLFGKRRILLMTEPHLVDQLRDRELPFYRKHISINIPFYYLAGMPAGKRMHQAQAQRAGCYVVSYSLLSSSKGAELLEAIQPDLIIGDEIHAIASANPSARGRRFKHIVKVYSPQIVGLSGTITKKSPKDYHHLVVSSLHENSFIPRPTGIADEWAKIIDCNASSIDEFHNNSAPQPGPIKPLVDWAIRNFPEEEYPQNLVGFRKAFQKRMETCPGVVASGGDKLGVSLRITNIDSKDEHEFKSKLNNEDAIGWEQLQELVKQLLTMWVAPNGDEIDHAMHIWRWRYELEGFGFYNNLFWPEAAKIVERKGISLVAAEDILERSKAQHELHQEYMKELRSWIKNRGKKGLDTPFLIGGNMYSHGDRDVGHTLYQAWSDMNKAKFPEMIERDKAIVRVCDFRVRKIVEWAKTYLASGRKKMAIIWFQNRGVAEWLKEEFEKESLPMVYCPAGKHGKDRLEDRSQGDKFAIASISSYHKGLNLQYHHHNEYFAQWPRQATWAEQAMGRVHRNEQPEDECRIFGSWNSEFDKVNFAACINDAAYIHQTVTHQKLLYADYDERPKILPSAVINDWGAQATVLNAESTKLLEDRFCIGS